MPHPALPSTTLELHLQDNQPVRLRDARGLTLTCSHGCVWITLAGEHEDIFLHPGDRYCVPRRGLLLVDGIGPARVRIAATVSASPAHGHIGTPTLQPAWSLRWA